MFCFDILKKKEFGGGIVDNTIEWLKNISEISGVSGYEKPVRDMLVNKLSSFTEVTNDKLGSVIFTKKGSKESPKIMLASHMDEIGFMVKYITKEGYLKFTTLGGWWEQVMLGQRVTVIGSKGEIPGVIGSKPPHILTPEERKKIVPKKEMFIDVGAADEKEAREVFGIKPGDCVVPVSSFTVMANKNMLMGKAWDNRIGCAVMADVLLALAEIAHNNTVYGVGTVQEEVGLRGAQTSVRVINPDIAFAVDTCIAGDTPGVSEDQATSKLGKGVAISIYDSSMIPHIPLRDFVIKTAEENNISYQLDFMEGGGTDAGRIHVHHEGVPSLVLSIPTRYIHSHNSIIHRGDYEAAVKLLVAIIKKLDIKEYAKLLE